MLEVMVARTFLAWLTRKEAVHKIQWVDYELQVEMSWKQILLAIKDFRKSTSMKNNIISQKREMKVTVRIEMEWLVDGEHQYHEQTKETDWTIEITKI